MYIWFNLLLFSSGHWMYVETLETLEECQELKIWYENVHPGNYYCLPAQVKKS
jgi:hypothetical protein